MQTVLERKNLLYPLLVVAAITVIALSGLGIAALTGLLPEAHSTTATPSIMDQTCVNCGVIESVAPYHVSGSSSGLGAVAGGVVGGLLGNTIGAGSGRVVATIVGAGGGAYAGNTFEKKMNKITHYRVTVRMDNGSTRVFHLSSTSWRPGDHVRITGGSLAIAG